jgi:hypothetical protein
MVGDQRRNGQKIFSRSTYGLAQLKCSLQPIISQKKKTAKTSGLLIHKQRNNQSSGGRGVAIGGCPAFADAREHALGGSRLIAERLVPAA